MSRSKLKGYMGLNGIRQKDLCSGSGVSPQRVSAHHRGFTLRNEEEEAILMWLASEKGLTPARKTIF